MEEKTINLELELKKIHKTQKLLSKIFHESERVFNDSELLNNNFGIRCPANISCIIPKNETAKLILKPFLDPETEKDIFKSVYETINKLEYNKGDSTKVNISSEYLKKYIDILESCDYSIKIYTKEDYPIKLENKFFWVIIAPRVQND